MARVEIASYQKDWRNSKATANPKEGTYQECENNVNNCLVILNSG